MKIYENKVKDKFEKDPFNEEDVESFKELIRRRMKESFSKGKEEGFHIGYIEGVNDMWAVTRLIYKMPEEELEEIFEGEIGTDPTQTKFGNVLPLHGKYVIDKVHDYEVKQEELARQQPDKDPDGLYSMGEGVVYNDGKKDVDRGFIVDYVDGQGYQVILSNGNLVWAHPSNLRVPHDEKQKFALGCGVTLIEDGETRLGRVKKYNGFKYLVLLDDSLGKEAKWVAEERLTHGWL